MIDSLDCKDNVDKSRVADPEEEDVAVYETPEVVLLKENANVGTSPSMSAALAVQVMVSVAVG